MEAIQMLQSNSFFKTSLNCLKILFPQMICNYFDFAPNEISPQNKVTLPECPNVALLIRIMYSCNLIITFKYDIKITYWQIQILNTDYLSQLTTTKPNHWVSPRNFWCRSLFHNLEIWVIQLWNDFLVVEICSLNVGFGTSFLLKPLLHMTHFGGGTL